MPPCELGGASAPSFFGGFDAGEDAEAAALHGDVFDQEGSGEGEGQVPAAQGGEEVQADEAQMKARPIYETADSLAVEREMLDAISERWQVQARKLPRRYEVDSFMMEGDRIVGVLEVKRRYHSAYRYPSLYLSLGKYCAGRRWAALLKVPFFFVVQFDDVLSYWQATDTQGRGKPLPPIVFGGRTDRNDWQDQEPVLEIPQSDIMALVCR